MKAKKVIQIQEDIPDTHCFVYKGRKYPINFNLFLYSSNFFLNDQDRLQKTQLINLVDKQSEDKFNISDEVIRDFIKYVHREPIEIDDDNVSVLNYLATKYQIESLIAFTQQYINQNQKDIIIQLLILNQNDPTVDTKSYEDFISNDLLFYIKDDRLLSVNFSILYRILVQYKEPPSDELIDFYFKCLDKYGRVASILFEKAEFTQLKADFLNRLMTTYSKVFDFHFVDSSFMKKFYECESQLILSVEETRMKLEKQETINQKLTEKVDALNNKLIRQQNEMLEKMSKQLSSLLEKQKKDLETKMQTELNAVKKKYDDEIGKLKDEIEKLKENQLKIDQKQKDNIIELPHSNDFQGIIKYLTDINHGNIHDNYTINVSSNSISGSSNHPKNLLDFNESSFYHSNKVGNATITFDFKDISIQLFSYSIKGYGYGSSGIGCLRYWVVEGSNDGVNYEQIDQRNNDSSLRGTKVTATFNVQNHLNKFYRYIQLRQTGQNWDSHPSYCYYIYFYYIEFYGKLKLSK